MDKDLLTIILAAAFAILSAVISNNKKKAAARQQPNTPSVAGDPYNTSEHSTDMAFGESEVSDLNYHEAEPEPWSYDSQIINETTRQMPSDVITMHAMGKAGREIKTDKRGTESSGDVKIHYPEDGAKDIIEDFNLRDAIIYSELLKPKFEQ